MTQSKHRRLLVMALAVGAMLFLPLILSVCLHSRDVARVNAIVLYESISGSTSIDQVKGMQKCDGVTDGDYYEVAGLRLKVATWTLDNRFEFFVAFDDNEKPKHKMILEKGVETLPPWIASWGERLGVYEGLVFRGWVRQALDETK